MRIDKPLTCPRCTRKGDYDARDLRRSTRHRGAYECPCKYCGERFVLDVVEQLDGSFLVHQWGMKVSKGRTEYAPRAEARTWRR